MGVEDHAVARRTLVEYLRDAGEIRTEAVAAAIGRVPRHEFVPEPKRECAYEDQSIDIGQGQVATAPHLVARMTELLAPKPGARVLEVGTGSGYHAAVLADLVGSANVVTVERFPSFARRARANLDRAGFEETTVVVGDGSCGLARTAAFDCISVAAVAPSLPEPLVDQLAAGGRLVIPLGPRHGSQELVLAVSRDGEAERSRHGRVRFVPLVGECGFDG